MTDSPLTRARHKYRQKIGVDFTVTERDGTEHWLALPRDVEETWDHDSILLTIHLTLADAIHLYTELRPIMERTDR